MLIFMSRFFLLSFIFFSFLFKFLQIFHFFELTSGKLFLISFFLIVFYKQLTAKIRNELEIIFSNNQSAGVKYEPNNFYLIVVVKLLYLCGTKLENEKIAFGILKGREKT